ncbi:ImmA/IrrE family metallo-endopeptidase [Rhodococcus sp. NPDC076796]|uniref:ImmA/IrrE family metallo-endopeptidase n=1 Tax=Rhodococcus sp. NPDC076796 TaxID=3154859 RepID=UPI00344D6802
MTVRDQATSYGQVAADIASVIEKYVELPELVLPHFSVPLEPDSSPTPEDAARWLRAEWNLPDGPLSHVVRLIENKGIIVVFSTPGASSVDAFSFDTDNRPLIILNPLKDDYYRQRFDAAHELGHLIMHRDSEPGGRVVEEQANRFASEFLMPEFEIRESLPTSINSRTWVQLGRLKEDWGASMQAILHKSRRLNLLTDGSYRNAMMTVSSRGWRRHEPGLTAALEQPSLLARSIEILLEGGFTESDLLSECRAPLSLFRQVVSRTPDPTN